MRNSEVTIELGVVGEHDRVRLEEKTSVETELSYDSDHENDVNITTPLANITNSAKYRLSRVGDIETKSRIRCCSITVFIFITLITMMASLTVLYFTIDIDRRKTGIVMMPSNISSILFSLEQPKEERARVMDRLNNFCMEHKCDFLFTNLKQDLSNEEDQRDLQILLFESMNPLKKKSEWSKHAIEKIPWIMMDGKGMICRVMSSSVDDEEISFDCSDGVYDLYSVYTNYEKDGVNIMVINTESAIVQQNVDAHLKRAERRWTDQRWSVIVYDKSIHNIVEEVYCREVNSLDAAGRARLGKLNGMVDLYTSPDASVAVRETNAGIKNKYKWLNPEDYKKERFGNCTLHDKAENSNLLHKEEYPGKFIQYIDLVSASRHIHFRIWDSVSDSVTWKFREETPVPA